MIKKFFAKLTNWNPYKHEKWQKEMADKGREVDRVHEGLIRERELMQARMKDAQLAEGQRILNQREQRERREEINLNKELDAISEKGKQDRAA